MKLFLKIIVIIGIIFFMHLDLSAQELYHRVKIDLVDKDIKDLARLGIEVDHGQYAPGKFLINDFSASELALIKSKGYTTTILIEDVSSYYASPHPEDGVAYRMNCGEDGGKDYDYDTPINYTYGSMRGYHTYSQMLEVLKDMQSKYPNLISRLDTIQPFVTYDGNVIHYLRMSNNPATEDISKPQVLYTALHHAREPNSLSQMLFYMWYLLENYETDPAIQAILNNVELYFVPCLNPDGYIINEINNPNGGGLWRKNAFKQDTTLFGVDLNRNYGHFWGFDDVGSSPFLNSQTYRGESAFSEPETQAIRAFCESHNFKLALNYHTHGNLLIHPWGYSDEITAEHDLFTAMGKKMIEENEFTFGTGTETVGYTVNGDSDDWMYGEDITKNPIYSFTPEVGPSFWPDSSQIDFLNKSCVKLNINTALTTLNFYYLEEAPGSSQYISEGDTIFVNVVKPGLQAGNIEINVYSQENNLLFSKTDFEFELFSGETSQFKLPIVFNGEVQNGDPVTIELKYDMELITDSLTISKIALKDGVEPIIFDDFTTLNNWNSDGIWSISNEDFTSDSTCLVSSLQNPYPNQFDQYLYFNDTLNLGGYLDGWISFQGKWNIENDFDYVQLQVARVGESFEPLCGKYTNLGSQYQDTGNPLYDGVQNDWVNEEISLKEYLNDNIVLRLYFHSDQAVNGRGFLMDDFSIVGIQSSLSNNSVSDNSQLVIAPNPNDGYFNVDFPEEFNPGNVNIYNLQGVLVKSIGNISNTKLMNLSNLDSGIYMLELIDAKKVNRLVRKLIISKN